MKFRRSGTLNYDELSTVLVEVEAALNSLPLTYVFDEMEEPLTPSHLIVGRKILSVPWKSSSDEVGQTEETLTRRAKFLQRILDHFWNRWLREYLPLLQERKKWVLKWRNLAVNDLILVVTEKLPRGHWLLGRVLKVFPGPDGLVRTAEVKTKNSTLLRPIFKLCLLEESK